MSHRDHTPEKGAVNGLATLDGNTKIPVSQLPQATEGAVGVAEIATQGEVDAGTDDLRFVTPLKLAAFIGGGGGIVTAIASSSVLDTTASGTATLMTGMTLTPGAGTYLAFFLGEGQVDKNSRFVFSSIWFNGVEDSDSYREIGGQSGNLGSWPSAAIGTVADGQTIEARWGMTNPGAGALASCDARTLVLIKVG